MLPGIMGLILSLVNEAHNTSRICNGLQALLMTTGKASPQRHPQLICILVLWTAAGVDKSAHHWTRMTGSQKRLPSCLRSQLLLVVCACLRTDHGRLRISRTMATRDMVPAALLKLIPLVTSSLATNLWRFQQNLNPSPGPSQLVVPGLSQSHWWTLHMQLSSHVSRSA